MFAFASAPGRQVLCIPISKVEKPVILTTFGQRSTLGWIPCHERNENFKSPISTIDLSSNQEYYIRNTPPSG